MHRNTLNLKGKLFFMLFCALKYFEFNFLLLLCCAHKNFERKILLLMLFCAQKYSKFDEGENIVPIYFSTSAKHCLVISMTPSHHILAFHRRKCSVIRRGGGGGGNVSNLINLRKRASNVIPISHNIQPFEDKT